MSYSVGQIWALFLKHLKNAADEDLRQKYLLIQKDRIEELLSDKELRNRAKNGEYGGVVKDLWNKFKNNR